MSYWPVYKSMNLRKILSPRQTKTLSDSFHQYFTRFVEPFEADMPRMVTSNPGPKAIAATRTMNELIGNSTVLSRK